MDEEQEIKDNLIRLLSSKDERSIELAIQLIIGQKIKVTQEMLDSIEIPLIDTSPTAFNLHSFTAYVDWLNSVNKTKKECPIMSKLKQKLKRIWIQQNLLKIAMKRK